MMVDYPKLSPRLTGPQGSIETAVKEISAVCSSTPSSDSARDRILNFIQEYPDALYRSCEAGHLTGSAAIVDHTASKFLLMHHLKLRKWLQPGGHADGDGLLSRVALREAREETGIEDLQIYTPGIDCDVHIIPERADEPEHLHLDIRYLLRAPRGSQYKKNHESTELRWVSRPELVSMKTDTSTLRLAEVALEIAKTVFPSRS
ncbi:MAG: NUDIX hydrolase [Actinomycetota bacterium]|nr:NUDIX hydrolase [Actinomycetota bacterium]